MTILTLNYYIGSNGNQETVVEALLFRADETARGKTIQMKLCERKLQINGSVFKLFNVFSSTKPDGEATTKAGEGNGGDCVICLTNPASGIT